MGKTRQGRGCDKFPVHSISFNSNDKSDEEIVNTSTYPFNMKISELLKNSSKTRRAKRIKRTGKGNPPRPQNAFFLYRRDKMESPEFKNRIAQNKQARIVSKEIGQLWKKEPRETIEVFYALARLSEKKHSETYINYKFLKKNQQQQIDNDYNDNETESLSHDSSQESSSPPTPPTTPPTPTLTPITTHVLPNLETTEQNYLVDDQQFFLVGCKSGRTYFLDVNAARLTPINLTYGHTDYQQSP